VTLVSTVIRIFEFIHFADLFKELFNL